MQLKFSVLDQLFTIHRLAPDSQIPHQVFTANLYSITNTPEELSIVCPSSIEITSENKETEWRCLKVAGPLDFSLTGILASISTTLAENNISLFAISTFDTDYLLIKSNKLEQAKRALRNKGHHII